VLLCLQAVSWLLLVQTHIHQIKQIVLLASAYKELSTVYEQISL